MLKEKLIMLRNCSSTNYQFLMKETVMRLLKGFTDGIMLAIFWLTISFEFTFIIMTPDDFIIREISLILSIKTSSLLLIWASTALVLCYINFRKSNLDKVIPEMTGFAIILISSVIALVQNNTFQ